MDKLFIWLQHLLPQHLLTKLLGKLANAKTPWLKNFLIKSFIRHYQVDMSLALKPNPADYQTFNDFFIRDLKTSLRPIAAMKNAISSPVDGKIIQFGSIKNTQLTQAKGMYFSLSTLLGGNEDLSALFHEGSYMTFYLAPKDYHCVHMPISGQLKSTTFIPGKLFSVNMTTSALIPNLYARNERLVTVFDTEAGSLAIILIGAMVVGSIQTAWLSLPLNFTDIKTMPHDEQLVLRQGEKLGHFKMGSTVILLFGPHRTTWLSTLDVNTTITYGQLIGHYVPFYASKD